MDKIINVGIPHVGERIFETVDTPGLIHCQLVSRTWKAFAEKILFKRFRRNVCDVFEFEERIQTEVFKILLDWSTRNKIDFNMKNENGRTAFIWACSCGYTNVVQLFLDYFDSKHIDLNTRDNLGETGFYVACSKGHIEVIKLLLNHSVNKNIDLDAKSIGGFTAFMRACLVGQTDIVKMLVQHANRTNIELPIFSMCRHLKYSKNPEITFNNDPEKTELRRSSRKKLEKIYLENGIYLTVL